MNCPKCSVGMAKSHAVHHYVESGLDNIWIDSCTKYTCPNCKGDAVILPDTRELQKAIASILVTERTRLDGRSICFLRKAMKLTSEALASEIGVNRVEISRWENLRAKIDPYHEFRLRLQVINRLLSSAEQDGAKKKVADIFGLHDIRKAAMSGEKRIQISKRQLAAV